MPARIAVVLPTCNRLGMLKRTLRSLEEQEFKDFTVYLSDDASKDGTRLLGSTDFPRLNVLVTRRLTSFPTLMDHFTNLFYSVKEEIVVMAHDDEVYHPALLRLIHESFEDPHVVFSYGQTVAVDAKTPVRRFYIDGDQVMDGLFTGEQMKIMTLANEIYLPANGFGVRTSALAGVAPFFSEYEQFDYEWMMRVMERGMTRVFPQYVASYTIHSSNTVGSRKYLDRMLKQKTANHMREEWLASLTSLESEKRQEIARRLDCYQADLEWTNFLRSVGYGEVELGRLYGQRVLQHRRSSGTRKVLARLALAPGFNRVAAWGLGTILRRRAKRPMYRRSLTLLEKSNAVSQFPTLALFEQPLEQG